MKIITDNVAYVQKNDIAYLNQTDLAIPTSIYLNSFQGSVIIVDDSNRWDFLRFEAPEEIEFFKGIDWMIDYNNVKDLSEEEIIALGQSIAEEHNDIAKKYNSMSLEKRKARYKTVIFQLDLLDFKYRSLASFLLFKQGQVTMELPEGTDLPTIFVKKKTLKK